MNTIQEKALLVSLSIGMPGNVRQDKKLTKEFSVHKHMDEEGIEVRKRKYPESALKPFSNMESAVRDWYYDHSLPWTDDGWRILTGAMYMDFVTFMRGEIAAYYGLVDTHWKANYQSFIDWARIKHNSEFQPEDYPLPGDPAYDKIIKKFRFALDFKPIPEGRDFRVQMQNEEAASIQANIDQQVKDAIDNAHRSLWGKLMTPVRNMAQKLVIPIGEKHSGFKNTLVENIREMVGLIPALDLKGDATLEAFRREIEDALSRIDPELLRTDAGFRNDTAKRADEILKRMQGYCQ